MKTSRRVQRMERHHKRNRHHVELNIVALMDIFTLLVFFLLVNVSSDTSLPNAKSIKLPESVAENKPKETLILIVGDKDIVLGGRKVADVASVVWSKSDLIIGLKTELELQAR
ncbi:MAG: biopolymer transporter ExbD, partial [Gammaproteobacteria bacterium]|nr:biopolymer transporter ExbD [Gammaproteobacteria bacterium]